MKKILVVGDAIKDVYNNCTFKKMCPDAPHAPALVHHDRVVAAGGAANVAANVGALAGSSAKVELVAVMDVELTRAVKHASRNNVEFSAGCDRRPITKTRFVVDDNTLMRYDNPGRVQSVDRQYVAKRLRESLAEREPDLILVSDYAGGCVEDDILEILRPYYDRCLVDTKRTDLLCFQGVLAIKLNRDEWEAVTSTEHSPERFCRYLYVTKGSSGAVLAIREQINEFKSLTHRMAVESHRVKAVDVCGCGDTFLAGLAVGFMRTGDPYTAMQIANAAAATVVTKRGTAVADPDEVQRLCGLGLGESVDEAV